MSEPVAKAVSVAMAVSTHGRARQREIFVEVKTGVTSRFCRLRPRPRPRSGLLAVGSLCRDRSKLIKRTGRAGDRTTANSDSAASFRSGFSQKRCSSRRERPRFHFAMSALISAISVVHFAMPEDEDLADAGILSVFRRDGASEGPNCQ